MRTTFVFVGICACLMMIISCGDKTAEKSATLTGKVTDTDTSIAIQGARVFEESHARLSTLTDSLGIFRLDGVMFEEHNIYVEKEGFKPETLWFEYAGKLSHPLLSRKVALTRLDHGK